jgi:hypothetical protein
MKTNSTTYSLLLAGLLAFSAGIAEAGNIVDRPWQYTTKKPGSGWFHAGFNDRGWKIGFGGFGQRSTPNSRIATEWKGKDIWLRQAIELKDLPGRPALYIYHDEDAEVFINGTQVATFDGYVTRYRVVPLEGKGRAALRRGANLIAVHCRQKVGGQAIDVHVIDADNVPKLPAPKQPDEPFKSELVTKWGAAVTPGNAWREYPRPNLVRRGSDGEPAWKNLNGEWDYAITSGPAKQPIKWAGKILVPFCVESKLSGVQRLLNPGDALWYRRSFEWGKKTGRRAMLNFEAVDHSCQVWVNGREVGRHVGGNSPFQFDVTGILKPVANEVVVRVEDTTGGTQLRGKQRLDPRGIWYTRVSGIWQTVWLEEVPDSHIEKLRIRTRKDGLVEIAAFPAGLSRDPDELEIIVSLAGAEIVRRKTPHLNMTLAIPSPKLWSPDSPTLYDLEVRLNGDVVHSYFGIREVGKTRDADGHLRFTLNGNPIFHWGPLDQGWWPDGLLTPPSDAAMEWEIRWLKTAGFNMIRKHIKVEPRRYYHHCDRIGMLVWQDQVSAIKNPKWTRLKPDPKDAEWTDSEHRQFMRELREMMASLDHFPSIVMWVPFNEAWGQHRTVETGNWVRSYDSSRSVNVASGGNFWPVGDVVDAHAYPHPSFPFDAGRYDQGFIKVMGEFGGHGWPVAGHLWDNSRRNWGYGGLPKNIDEYNSRYRESLRILIDLKRQGISAGVYTQTTDVEGEINGLISYDRKVIKIPAAELAEWSRKLVR